MRKFKAWFHKVTLGQTKYSLKLMLWAFFDNYISSAPYAVMLMAMYLLMGPVITPGAQVPVKGILILCGVLGVQAIIHYFVARKTYVIACAGFASIVRKSRISMGEVLRQLPMGFYGKRDVGDLTTVLLRDYETVELSCNDLLPKIAVIAARLSLSLVVLSVFSWRMTLATMIVIPLAIPFAACAYKKLAHKNTGLLDAQQDNTARILEYIAGIQTLKAFNQSDEMYVTLRESCENLRKKSIDIESSSAPVGMLSRAVLNAGIAIVMAYGMYLLLQGVLAPLTLLVFLMLALNIYNPIMSFMAAIINIPRLTYCAQRIEDVINEKPLAFVEETKVPLAHDIEFKNVCFGYGKNEVLHNLSFKLPEKSLTALIGPSGSGKSTITRLIARFWDVNSGEITLGGTGISQMKPDEVLSQISMVFQDVYLFHDTIENNIRMGNPEASDDEVVQAAKKAACHSFISALPDGYKTIVGEGGSTLSGGEKQRISIARALLKNAPIILLDEATASLDPQNEILIQQAIDALVKDKTVVIIAHRLRSVQNADQVVVLESGNVAQVGKHDELLKQSGIYSKLWNQQQKAGQWKIA